MSGSPRTLPFQGKGETGRKAYPLLSVLQLALRCNARGAAGGTNELRRKSMATVLIVGNDCESRRELAASLRTRGHSVLVSDYQELLLPTGGVIASEVEIAIFDVTSLNERDTSLLRQLCLHDPRETRSPLVLCYSLVNRGPGFELAMESIGARFAYA
jgi:response regulator RpfG family c-di-GMP phosphodiesterase